MTKTYDGVIRVSRKNGRDASEWLTEDQQREAILRDAASRGGKIARWHDESDSVSGKTTDRVGLNAAVERAINGEIDGIIVAKLDRFARTVVGGLTTINRLKAAGKELIAEREGVIVGDGAANSATGNLMRTFFLMLAQWQLETLTEGWESVRASHIARGIHTVEPYGYLKGDDRRLYPVAAESPVVLRMFEERAEGAGWVGIAESLNGDDIKTRAGHGWTAGRVKSIVEARVYLGEVRSGEFVNPDAHEAIVSAELWERANARRKTTARRDGEDYPLTGLLYCSECGVRMRGTTTHKAGTAYRSYKCRVNHPFGRCPAPANINADDIERAAMDTFADRYFGITLNGHADTSALDAATAELEAAEHDLATAAIDPVLERLRTIAPAAYADGLSARMARVEAARADRQTARNEALGVEFPATLEQDWPRMTADERRGFLTEAFDLIAVARAERGTPFADRRVRLFGRGEAPAGVIGRRLTNPVSIAV
jgi:DNA invertase Pin-like site-specific DNA recombinase